MLKHIQRVEIFPAADKPVAERWYGTLIEEGPVQSVVRITKATAVLTGVTQCSLNEDLRNIPQNENDS